MYGNLDKNEWYFCNYLSKMELNNNLVNICWLNCKIIISIEKDFENNSINFEIFWLLLVWDIGKKI